MKENRRDLLLRAAARLFREKGYARATIRDLARAIDLQSGSIFHYFDSKDAILFSVMERAIIDAIERMETAVASANDPSSRLRALIRAELGLIHHEETRDGMEVTFYAWESLSEEARGALLALRDRYEAIWMTELRAADDAGLISGDPALLRRFLTGSQVWTVKWFRTDGPLSLDALADETHALLTGASRAIAKK